MASNEAVSGFTSFDVLHQLSSASAAIDQVKAARLVEVEVGANDVAPSSSVRNRRGLQPAEDHGTQGEPARVSWTACTNSPPATR